VSPRRASAPRAALRSAPAARVQRPRDEHAREHVILLHGIWMRGITLHYLLRRMQQAGYDAEALDYASVFGGFETAVEQVREHVRNLEASTVHLVGHSLGALVALEAARGGRRLPRGRVVCLGPPLRGSAVARGLAAVPGGRWLMGHSVDPLLAGIDEWRGSRKVGVIAGKLPFGLGVAIGTLSAPHDGTVSVEETQLRGIADHRTVSASHTGMLVSSEVADLTIQFLRDGRFTTQA